MKFALSILCESPVRKTGLTSLFREFVAHALELFPQIDWIVFAGPEQEWDVHSPRVNVVRLYPANDRLLQRLFADHFLVSRQAKRLGATVLLTVGFVPLIKRLPTILHLFSFQHRQTSNKVGGLRSLYRRLIVNRGIRVAERIIVNSHFAADQLLQTFPTVRDRMLVSYEGLQHEEFMPDAPGGTEQERARLKEKFGLDPGYLLWTSNFYAYKQADLLLAAFARLSLEQRAAHPLIMVGGGWQGGIEAARAHTETLGIAEQVKFLGWVDDEWLAPLYRQAAVFCLASREETFGRCVAEAMACGTPCVVNRIPVMREVTGGHALIVDFTNTKEATAALNLLIEHPEEHARLRETGIAWVQQFNFDRLAKERIESILQALG